MKLSYLAAASAAVATAVIAVPAAAQSVVNNTSPTQAPFTYGNGNDYTPANASVLTNGGLELAARFHVNGLPANPSNNGVYSFALGTTNINFDYSAFGFSAADGANVLLTNLMTGATASYNILAIADANGANPGYQGSQQLRFGFLNGTSSAGNLGFNANVDNTYRFDFSAGGNTLTTFAQVGTGAAIAPVPEPATWAMMMLGFGGMGYVMRRKNKVAARIKFA